MAALLYLKHAFNLSDEELVARWSENVVWQYFSGQDYYTHRNCPCDATQIGRFHTAIGEAGGRILKGDDRHTAIADQAVRPAEFGESSSIRRFKESHRHPVDSRLLELPGQIVQTAKRVGIAKQTFVKEGKALRRKSRLRICKQFKASAAYGQTSAHPRLALSCAKSNANWRR